MDYDQIVMIMRMEFNSNARQVQVQNALENLRPYRFMTKKDINSVSNGLNKIVNHIEKLTSQCPPDFRQEPHSIRYLRNAVKQYSWSKIAISNIVTLSYSFTQLFTALHESLEFEDEIQHKKITIRQVGAEEGKSSNTLYQRYNRNPKHIRKRADPAKGFIKFRNIHLARTFEESRQRN